MNRFRVRVFSPVLLVLFALTVALQPATAQRAHARQAHHQAIPAGKTCSSCHKMTYAQWKSSPHGAGGVECTVCHGEITAQSVAATPALGTCDTCHSDQVKLLKTDAFMKGKTCVNCHQPHTFLGHPKAAVTGE